MDVPGNSNKKLLIGIKKAFDCSRIHLLTKSHEDLKLSVSRWSVESRTVCCCLERVRLTLKDVLNTMALPLYGETNAMGLTCKRESEDRL